MPLVIGGMRDLQRHTGSAQSIDGRTAALVAACDDGARPSESPPVDAILQPSRRRWPGRRNRWSKP